MKKSEVIAFGVPEDRVKEFQEVYHTELRNTAARMIRKENEREALNDEEAIKSAIYSMVSLMTGKERLNRILNYVNSQYFQMSKDKESERKEADVNKDNNQLHDAAGSGIDTLPVESAAGSVQSEAEV